AQAPPRRGGAGRHAQPGRRRDGEGHGRRGAPRAVTGPGASPRRIYSTAPLRGPGLDLLRELGEVVVDPWIDHRPLRLLGAEALAAEVAERGASVLVCEADECRGPVLDLPLEAIGSTRGDPTNVDVAGATAAGIPVLRAPGRNADGVAELAVGLLL